MRKTVPDSVQIIRLPAYLFTVLSSRMVLKTMAKLGEPGHDSPQEEESDRLQADINVVNPIRPFN